MTTIITKNVLITTISITRTITKNIMSLMITNRRTSPEKPIIRIRLTIPMITMLVKKTRTVLLLETHLQITAEAAVQARRLQAVIPVAVHLREAATAAEAAVARRRHRLRRREAAADHRTRHHHHRPVMIPAAHETTVLLEGA